jgi:hypothetical protein
MILDVDKKNSASRLRRSNARSEPKLSECDAKLNVEMPSQLDRVFDARHSTVSVNRRSSLNRGSTHAFIASSGVDEDPVKVPSGRVIGH